MRAIIVALCIVLTGCPAYSPWKIKNESSSVISIGSIRPNVFESVAKKNLEPGDLKKIKVSSEPCFIVFKNQKPEFYLWNYPLVGDFFEENDAIKTAILVYKDTGLFIFSNNTKRKSIQLDIVSTEIQNTCNSFQE